ncbi:MAG: chorismate-binding protein, partial [Schleiferiaceae bacterium]|nr:chorismate-binding protein [Schleiferiaceae bacterium]
VEHLCSWIEAAFDHKKAPQLASALHPTPAIGGLPRAQALAFLKEHEGYDRSWYSGYFGWKDDDRYAFFVNLRCMEIGSDGMQCYAGGGITSRSEPRAEWLETAAKLQTLEQVILH